MKRNYGSGQLYIKSGAYYVRWRTADGRRANRRLGQIRTRGEADGLTRAQAERAARAAIEAQSLQPVPSVRERPRTVDDAADSLRARLVVEGARLSYRQNCESMQRIHISPARQAQGRRRQDGGHRAARAGGAGEGAAPKTVRNTMTFLHSVFALAVKKGWTPINPVTDAARPRRRRAADANPDLQFLTPSELDVVVAAIPDVVLDRDSLGPVLRVLILTAGTTGIRQSELLGLRWRDVDVIAQRIRVRNAWVRGEHSGEGKSDLTRVARSR